MSTQKKHGHTSHPHKEEHKDSKRKTFSKVLEIALEKANAKKKKSE